MPSGDAAAAHRPSHPRHVRADSPIFDGPLPTTAPDLGAYLVRQDLELARFAERFGDADAAAHRVRAERTLGRLLELWDDDRGMFHARAAGAEVASDTVVGLMPLLTGRLPAHVVARLVALPRTLIHGEYYASNVLAQETAGGLRICPIDWEMAGWGPAAIDLAALVSGEWPPEQVIAFTEEYCAAWASLGGTVVDGRGVQDALCCCRIHLAVQWLGWAQDWRPPFEHTRDWLAEGHLAFFVADTVAALNLEPFYAGYGGGWATQSAV